MQKQNKNKPRKTKKNQETKKQLWTTKKPFVQISGGTKTFPGTLSGKPFREPFPGALSLAVPGSSAKPLRETTVCVLHLFILFNDLMLDLIFRLIDLLLYSLWIAVAVFCMFCIVCICWSSFAFFMPEKAHN